MSPDVEAGRVLAQCWAGRGLPIDPVRIATSLGLKVKEDALPAQVSGALIKSAGADPVILLQRGDSANRKRFTCAHELGHYVRRAGDLDRDFIDLRDHLAQQGSDPEEVFANQFAACLLMPEESVRAAAKGDTPLWRLAAAFKVSPDAMRFRLMNLGLPPT